MTSQIIFDGRSSADLRLFVERPPDPTGPARRITKYQVPGRSGDGVLDRGELDNYNQEYAVYLSADPGMVQEYAALVAEWLMGPRGYVRLEDSYTPDTYRLAMFAGPLEVANTLGSFGRATLKFDCLPYRRMKSGDYPADLSGGGWIVNPTQFDALPLIELTLSGAGALTVNDATIEIADMTGKIAIDCESMDAAGPDGTNLNAKLTAEVFPVLGPGGNQITYTGGVTDIRITPRWRTV